LAAVGAFDIVSVVGNGVSAVTGVETRWSVAWSIASSRGLDGVHPVLFAVVTSDVLRPDNVPAGLADD